MNAIEKYTAYAREVRNAVEWANLLGKKYHGGGGGIGSISSADASVTIYHQEYDGAHNYHESPDAFNTMLATIIMRRFQGLKDETIAAMKKQLFEASLVAKEEYANIARDAGLDLEAAS